MAATTEQSTGRRSYSKLLMALVPLTVVGTLAFWWLGSLPDEAHPEVGRSVFGNIPAPIVALFYVTIAVFLGLAVYLFAQRARNGSGAPSKIAPGSGRNESIDSATGWL